MKRIALLLPFLLTACECAPKAPAATPVAASPCAPAVAAPKVNTCNAPAVAMSAVTMPTPVAKVAAVPPNVVLCVVGFVRCLIDTLVAPLRP